MKTYHIYDRLSKRHDWQLVGNGDEPNWFNWVITGTYNRFNEWGKKLQYPNYQIAYIIKDNNDREWTLSSNFKMDKVVTVLEGNFQNLLQTVDTVI